VCTLATTLVRAPRGRRRRLREPGEQRGAREAPLAREPASGELPLLGEALDDRGRELQQLGGLLASGATAIACSGSCGRKE